GWVAFHGKDAAKAVSPALGHGSDVRLGEQTWTIGEARVFVLPNASGANRDASRLEGKTDRVEWFKDLAARLPAVGRERASDALVRSKARTRAFEAQCGVLFPGQNHKTRCSTWRLASYEVRYRTFALTV